MKSIGEAVRKIFSSLEVDEKSNRKSQLSIQKGRALHAADLRRLLVSCRVCGLNFDAHSYSALAMTISSEDTKLRLSDFLAAIRENRWQEVLTYNEFDGSKDAVEATAIRCPKGTTTMVIEFNPQELFYNRSILGVGVLSIESNRELNSLISNVEWHAL